MPTSAGWALQVAIHAALSADSGLLAHLGGARIYDHVPRNAAYPFVTFGQTIARDWTTGTEDGLEHTLTLHVWSIGGSRRETHDIMDAVRNVLEDATLALSDHRLVQIRHEYSDARPDPDREAYHGILRYRAVTEPLN